MSGTSIVGDETEIDCPWCEKPQNIQDVTTDGCLKVGFEGECRDCLRPWVITEVEYRATVWVDRLDLKKVSGGVP